MSQGQPLHRPARNEAAGADDVAAIADQRDHLVDNPGIEIVVGGVHHDNRRGRCGKAGHHGGMRPSAGIADEGDFEAAVSLRMLPHRGQGIVFLKVVADQHARRSFDLPRKRAQGREDIGPFIVDRDDDVELMIHHVMPVGGASIEFQSSGRNYRWAFV